MPLAHGENLQAWSRDQLDYLNQTGIQLLVFRLHRSLYDPDEAALKAPFAGNRSLHKGRGNMTYDNKRFRVLLENKQKELVHSIRSMSEQLIIGDIEHDVIDHVQSMGSRDRAVTILDAMTRTLSDIDAALLALHDGSYGICMECEEPVALKRLETIPWASHCIRCQEALENRDRRLEERSYWRDAA